MTSWKDWQTTDAEFARDFAARMEDLTPEPLFESNHLPGPKVCLRCGQERAVSLLASVALYRDLAPGPWIAGALLAIGCYFLLVGSFNRPDAHARAPA